MIITDEFQLIKGKTVVLHVKTSSGTDAFGAPTFTETTVNINNVLIQPVDTVNSSVLSEVQLEGKHLQYILHIPKTDNHTWDNTEVEFYGKTWKTFGAVKVYDADNTPGPYNKQVKVEAYE